MKYTSHSLFNLFVTASLAANTALANPPIQNDMMNEDEQRVASMMQSRNVNNFLLMNEHTAKIKYIQDGLVSLISPAISGKIKGDSTEKNQSVTPAGIFLLRPVENADQIVFYTDKIAYLIHPSNGGKRMKLFQGNNPDKMRASDGCIAVPEPVFAALSGMMKENTGRPNFLIVLPEEERTSSFLRKHFPASGQIQLTIK